MHKRVENPSAPGGPISKKGSHNIELYICLKYKSESMQYSPPPLFPIGLEEKIATFYNNLHIFNPKSENFKINWKNCIFFVKDKYGK